MRLALLGLVAGACRPLFAIDGPVTLQPAAGGEVLVYVFSNSDLERILS